MSEILWRVAPLPTRPGPWYSIRGDRETKLPGSPLDTLPMPHDDAYKAEPGLWLSAARDLDYLRSRFGGYDKAVLRKAGYQLFRVDAEEVREVGDHVMFRLDSANFQAVAFAMLKRRA